MDGVPGIGGGGGGGGGGGALELNPGMTGEGTTELVAELLADMGGGGGGGGGGGPDSKPGILSVAEDEAGAGSGGGGMSLDFSFGAASSTGVRGESESRLGCEGPVVIPSPSSSSLASIRLTLDAISPNRPVACLGFIWGRFISTIRGLSKMTAFSASSSRMLSRSLETKASAAALLGPLSILCFVTAARGPVLNCFVNLAEKLS